MKFIRVETTEDAKKLIQICPNVISIDTEYVPGDPRTTKLLSIILADDCRAWIVSPLLLSMLTPMIRARKLIFLQDYNHCDTIILNANGCDLRNTLCYNLIDMHHLLNNTKDHSLEARVWETYQDDYKTRLKGQYEDLEYQGKDGIYTYKLGCNDLLEINRRGLSELLEHVRRTSSVLLDTEINGIVVDVELMKQTQTQMLGEIEKFIPKLREEFKDACTSYELTKWVEEINKRSSPRGKSRVPRPQFSFASNKQVCWLLYEYLKIPVTVKTKKGNPATDYETLKSLVERYPRIQAIVDYYEIKSVYGTFVEGMLKRVEDGKIYPHFNVSGTDTGRLSHSNPNMANLPTTGPYRKFFKSRSGYSFIGADYTQLEVVIEANLTKDSQLIKVIEEGVSKHDITAEGLKIDRNTAKTLNFALQYGAGVRKVGKILSLGEQEAESVYRRYWELYFGVRTLKEQTIKEIQETKKVTNLFKRTRYFPEPNHKWEEEKQYRQGYNFLIQGVAGDACNRALWLYDEWLKQQGYGKVMFSVHDEILAEVLDGHAEECKVKLVKVMESVSEYLDLKYPLTAKSYGPIKAWEKL